MSCSIDLLKHRYLKNIKENPELFVGIELEYPVASLEGDATDVEVIKDLFHYLVSTLDLTVAKVDDFGNLIQLVDPISQDAILFEVSYTTIEFAFGKAETIQEVENRFNNYIPNHSYLSQLDVTYKTPDLMSHFLPPHEVSFTFCCSSIVFPR
ncbi:hypothetical protein PC0027_20010 [Streptococcus pneumoniae]|nr:hypothetical protein PC0027_20010 [Streptococcus pneumoniae]